jgi:ribosome-binding factor A
MSNIGKKPPSQRQLKVGEELRHALSDIFMREDFYDAEVGGRLELTVCPDLRNATVYVVPLAGKEKEKTLKALNKQSPFIRSLASKKVQLRFMPALAFRLDTSYDRVSALEAIFNRPDVRRDLEKQDD